MGACAVRAAELLNHKVAYTAHYWYTPEPFTNLLVSSKQQFKSVFHPLAFLMGHVHATGNIPLIEPLGLCPRALL